METVNWTDFYAVGVFTFNAAFDNDKWHQNLPIVLNVKKESDHTRSRGSIKAIQLIK
jgi:hypothetical protein